VAVTLEVVLYDLGDPRLVLDDQDPAHRTHALILARRRPAAI
jgi:hypothetical protein